MMHADMIDVIGPIVCKPDWNGLSCYRNFFRLEKVTKET